MYEHNNYKATDLLPSRIRVAAYCRVSTDKTDQINSLENQKRYFYDYIGRNPNWQLVGIYADEGVTGTSTKKRREFNRMIDDALSHRFDIVITKEISRFARNTLDSIFYTRQLKTAGVGVIFMSDGINTLEADSELRLTIMSSIAQEESRKTSERVKWGQKRRMEQGIVFGRSMLGYDVKNGSITVNRTEADTVVRIFHKFLYEGKGTHVIARELREECVNTATHMNEWSNTAILRILRNEKYCGDLIQKKTYTPSYLEHTKKPNRGEEEYVVLRDHHEAIISREMFESTAAELARRSAKAKAAFKYSSRHCFSGKIKCGICGKSFVSLTKTRQDSTVYNAWRCSENAKNGGEHTDGNGNVVGCSNTYVNNEALREALLQVVSATGTEAEAHLKKVIAASMSKLLPEDKTAQSTSNKLEAVKNKRKRITELYAEGDISLEEFRELRDKYDSQIKHFEAEISSTQKHDAASAVHEAVSFVHELLSGTLWDDVFYRNILKKTTVYNDKIQLAFFGTDAIVEAFFM